MMKNTILSFLLGIFVTVSIAATTNNLMTVKPAVPKETVCFVSSDMIEIKSKILDYSARGYVVKAMQSNSSRYVEIYNYIVVMEKY